MGSGNTIYNPGKKHHEKVTPKHYDCDKCEFSTGDRSEVRRHVMDEHDITSEDMDETSPVSDAYTAKTPNISLDSGDANGE